MNRPRLHVPFPTFAAGLAFVLGAQLADAQQLSFTPFHKNGIYQRGEKAGWTVTLPQGGAAPNGTYTYVIKRNNFDTIKTARLR